MTPRVWWCSIWRWRARMNQSRTWLLASILASSLFIVAVRANSETGDEKSWQTKAVMRGWAGLGWARWRAHTQSCRGVNACHRHLQHLQLSQSAALELSQSVESAVITICSSFLRMSLRSEDIFRPFAAVTDNNWRCDTITSCNVQTWHMRLRLSCKIISPLFSIDERIGSRKLYSIFISNG